MQSFLKWPGGKRWLVANYHNIFPTQYNIYFEPFLGSGAVFFHLTPSQATIADVNQDLITTYRVMANYPKQLKILLETHQKYHCKDYYYTIRRENPDDEIACAARFIYLNRTCFNGMYRVNQQGYFNVPLGTKSQFTGDVHLFEKYAEILRKANILSQDFAKTIAEAKNGDLVFADPPYVIAHKQNSFVKYNEKIFSWRDQIRLLDALVEARDRGAIIIATNTIYPRLKQMYQDVGFCTQTVNRFSPISGKINGRGTQEELLITSFNLNLERDRDTLFYGR